MVSETGQVLSAEEMLSRSAKNVASGKNSKPKSAVEKLLAQRENPLEDIVDISPVQRLLKDREAKAKEKAVPYTEQDWFLQLKMNQLRAQLATYSSVPGLDPNGAAMNSIEAEIKSIIQKQQATLQESLKKADEAKAKLDEQERLKALEGPSPEELLARLNGTAKKPEMSKAVKAMLEKAAKGLIL